MNWYDVAAFCNLLTVADGNIANGEQVYYSDAGLDMADAYTKTDAASGAPVYVNWNKTGYRIPSEAEWEYSARYTDGTDWNNGDHVSGDMVYACYEYPPGSGPESGSPLASDARISEYAWWDVNNSPTGSKEVGLKSPNVLGLHDMTGNVYEWCYDWSAAYSGSPETDPIGPGIGSDRIARGGYWNYIRIYLRCGDRYDDDPLFRSLGIGFRLCRTAD